jgi:release factor glutamine methyltransferase
MSSSQPWTVARLIKWSAEYLAGKGCSSSPRLDGELLLAESLGVGRLDLYLEFQKPLKEQELAAFKALIKRRAEREPVAYILGRKGFSKIDLAVCPATLIPRPETEHLVEAALERLDLGSTGKVLELGTGAGGVILSLALERPGISLTATDISSPALDQARANAARSGLAERIEFLEGDLFEPVTDRAFDLILMNPPYIAEADYRSLAPEITCHEPVLALLAGEDGLDVIRRLIAQAPAHLEAGGWLLLEIGSGQGPAVQGLLQEGPFGEIRILPDLAGLDRVALARLAD